MLGGYRNIYISFRMKRALKSTLISEKHDADKSVTRK